MKRQVRRGMSWRRFGRIAALAMVVASTQSCNSIDTTRKQAVQATFGDDLYGVLCDRVGAGAFQEDINGASYRPVCHYDNTGAYGDDVDETLLPQPSGASAQEARRISVAKMKALARRRSDLVRAFNAIFPDTQIDDITKPGSTIGLHKALLDFGQRIVPLYEINPYNTTKEGLTPSMTRALGNLFDSIAATDVAKQMLSEMWGRQGYRPYRVGLGAVRGTLGYPNLRNFTVSSLGVLGPNGSASPQLQQLLGVGQQEMLNAKIDTEPLPTYSLMGNPNLAQPNRPRQTIEFMRDMLLSQDSRFAPTDNDPVRLISIRDKRGFVVPKGSQPGVLGTVPMPFVDMDKDGFADVDASGRFIDATGAPLSVARPFAIPELDSMPSDPYGRPDPTLYSYVDTSRTLAANLSQQMVPLLDATEVADPNDPNGFMQESETLMYAVAGANVLLGPREAAEYDFDAGKVVPVGTGCKTCSQYSRFRGEDSPLTDLVYAAGQVLGDQDSDALLLGLIDLMENHEQEVARLLGAALKVRQISLDYDKKVAAGMAQDASLPYENPLWDQVAQVVNRVVNTPGLTAELLGAIADDTLVTPIDGAQNMGDAIGTFAATRDAITYDPHNLNGPPLDTTVGPTSISNPMTPVNYNAPRNGTNRSLLEKAILLIHDARHAAACNKAGAKVKTKLAGIKLTYPPFGSGYAECQLFMFPDLADFYLDALLPDNHPKRSVMNLKPGDINALLSFVGNFTNIDNLLQQSSGIDGMTLHPSPKALNRLVWFGAPSQLYPNLPDYDALNAPGAGGPYSDTSDFVATLMEPAATIVCPPDPAGQGLCASGNDVQRVRDGSAIFSWEKLGFYPYLQPMILKFANVSCDDWSTPSFCKSQMTGEDMFTDLLDVMWTHFPGKDHGPECTTSGSYGDPRYCSGAGVNRYEPIISASAHSDLIPALHEFAKAAYNVSKITIARGPNAGQTMTGAQVMELTAKILFSQDYAAKIGLVDRFGKKSTTWTDGTPQSQLTVFNLFADGLHKIDLTFAAAGPDGALRQQMWKRARSQLVDALAAVEGTGPTAHFKNRGTAPLLIAILKLAREQINANCPTRETGAGCAWAKHDLAKKLSDQISNPMFASLVDLMEAVRQDNNARREMERYLTYLLQSTQDGETLQATLASMDDAMQVLMDDAKLAPLIQAGAVLATPEGQPNTGAADRTIAVLKALTDDKYDRYHVMDHILPNLVTPIDDGGPEALSPLEIIMDSIADIHRLDPSVTDPLSPDDYGAIMGTVRDFLTDNHRGLEQFYAIINNRQRK